MKGNMEPAEQNYQTFLRLIEKAAIAIERAAKEEIHKMEQKMSQQAQDKRMEQKIDKLEELNNSIKNQVIYLEHNYAMSNFGDYKENLDTARKDLEPFKKESPNLDYAIKNKATLDCMTKNLKKELKKDEPKLADLRKENKIYIHARAQMKDKTIYKPPAKSTQLSFDAACKNAIAKAAKAAIEAPVKQMQQQQQNQSQDMELSR